MELHLLPIITSTHIKTSMALWVGVHYSVVCLSLSSVHN